MKAKHGAPSGRRGCWIGLAVFFVLAVAGWYVLMGQAASPRTSTFELDLSKIRQMAQEKPGNLPVRLNAVVVGEGTFPRAMVIAGAGFQSERMPVAAYQLVYDDHTVMVDSTFPKEDFEQMFPGGLFDSQKYDSLQQALQKSRLILLTHMHLDHIAGITHAPNAAALLPKVLLSQEQIADMSAETGEMANLFEKVQAVTYEKYYAAAPGVVLIKSPGHSPGDQLIYVRLQDGREYLLVGDVVWNSANITQATGRPLLLRLLMQEDWQKSSNEIRALHDLVETEPIHLVITHDGPQLDEYIRQGLINDDME
ncbi:MAG: MBL fold metallo-hydrolase [Chloroflexi bacterium]|nr:MAG: MBL fold metallo-hydrolase [Chloroflexota bacterium]